MNNKVLIIDDDKDIVVAVVSLFEIYGFKKSNIFVAYNPMEGLDLFKENRSTITHVLCDYYMPKSNGGELCEIIKKNQPNITVILQTGDHSINLKNLNYVDDILQKPYGYDDLEEILKKSEKKVPKAVIYPEIEERSVITDDKVATFKLLSNDLNVRYYGIVLNQSEGGCCLALNITKEIKVGDQVKIKFSHYSEIENNYKMKEEVLYEVIWTKITNLDICTVGFQIV